MTTSLRRRVAVAVAVGAAVAAAIAATTAAVFTAVSLRAVEDRRLEDAAVVLAAELDRDLVVADDHAAIAAILADEGVEMRHTGIAFAIDVHGHTAGDVRLVAGALGCHDVDAASLRVCRVRSGRGFLVVAADVHTGTAWLFVLAALTAAGIAAVLGLLVSRPLADLVVAPLSRLRERLATIDVDARGVIYLGADEGIVEVDEVRATTAALLRQTREALDHARRFAADAAHELRTPLAAIGAELELLEERALGHDHHDDIAHVRTMTTRLQVLIDRLLILATPRGFARTETVALKDLAEDVVAGLPVIDRGRIDIVGDDSVQVRGDGVLLGTLLSNGLTNALKFARYAELRVQRRDGRAVVTISDDGPGIDVALRMQVFEPLFRADDARARRIEGHGLGLAIVAHIARLHDGDARFVDGVGACLEVELPLADTSTTS